MNRITKERFRELIFAACPTAKTILLYNKQHLTSNRIDEIYDNFPELHDEDRLVLAAPGFSIVTIRLKPIQRVGVKDKRTNV
jgi:hypothetical protein